MERGWFAVSSGCACCAALLATGCGTHRSSAVTFRATANRICRDVDREKRSEDFSSALGFARGLAGMSAAVRRLARLQPPPGEDGEYRDLLAKLRDIDERLAEHAGELLTLQRRLKHSSGRSAVRTIRRFRALVSPVANDGLRAAADARELSLGACATDLSGGAPLGPPLGGGGSAA